jgi:hypothetical protein
MMGVVMSNSLEMKRVLTQRHKDTKIQKVLKKFLEQWRFLEKTTPADVIIEHMYYFYNPQFPKRKGKLSVDCAGTFGFLTIMVCQHLDRFNQQQPGN